MNIKLDKQGLLHLVSGTVPPISAMIFVGNYGKPKGMMGWEWDMIKLAKLSEEKLFNIYQEIRKRMDMESRFSPWFYALNKPFILTSNIEYGA